MTPAVRDVNLTGIDQALEPLDSLNQIHPDESVRDAIALEHVRAALQAAEFRTAERVARGVEGTHEV